ncbi:MAG: right-handed parallel beta-helix repeat-containing protein, partial [Candidatus Bipolaricaulota bacterium]|nr:right-handed parallel beta-helix repeat-containing protein [Candidatus Bipolaricaulota bacterium]
GVVINNGASQNTIGPNNTIRYHYYDGVQIVDFGTNSNQIIQNTIINNGLGVVVLNTYPGSDAQIGPPTPGPANTLIRQNVINNNNNEGVFIRRDNGGTVISENQIQNNNGEGVLLIGSSPSIRNNTISQNAANGILALVYFGANDSPSTATDDVLSQPYNIENNTISANGGFGIFALDTPLGNLNAINANNNWSPDNALARIQQDWYGYVRVVDAFNNPVTGLTVQINQNPPCAGSYTSAVSDPNGNYGPTGFNINSERTYFQIPEAFVSNVGVLNICTPQTVNDLPIVLTGIYAYNGDYPNPAAEQGGAIESPPGSGVDRYQFALLQQPLSNADLRLTKSDAPDPVLVGTALTYTITVTNLGPSTATNVSVSDTLPSSVTFVLATSSQGACNPPVGNILTCNLGNLNPGDTVTITITVTPLVAGTINNTATVSSSTTDLTPGNNTDSESTTVEGPVGGDPPIWGTIMVFPAPEQHLGRGPHLDLNRNRRFNDCVLRYTDLQTGRVISTRIFVSCAPRDLDLYEQRVVFVTPEGKLGLYDLASGALTHTELDASHPAIFGEWVVFESAGQIALWDGKTVKLLGAGHDPVIWDKVIAFVGPSHTIQIYDLSRGELRDTGLEGAQPALYEGVVAFVARDLKKTPVIRLYEIATGRLEETGAVGSWPAIFGRYVVFETKEREIGSDLNGDGDRADTVIRYYDRERGRVFNTARVGSEPDIYDGLVAFWGYESGYGQDLNGDGDLLDPIVQTYRIPTETLAVPLRVTRIVLERLDRQGVRFVVEGEGVEAVRLEVYDLQGRVLYRSEFVPGQRVTWHGRDQDGALLANGVYLAVLTVKGHDRVERSAVQKIVVLR